MMSKLMTVSLFALLVFLPSCSDNSSSSSTDNKKSAAMSEKEIDPMTLKGIGPISEVDLPADIDPDMAAAGQTIYEEKCIACHHITEKMIGPPQKGILNRRSPEWVMNMILNPEEMIRKDPIAKKMLAEYNNIPMTNQHLTEEEARQILEYFRTIN